MKEPALSTNPRALRRVKVRRRRRTLRAAFVMVGCLVVAGASFLAMGGGSGANHPTTGSTEGPTSSAVPSTLPPKPQWHVAWGSAMAWEHVTGTDTTIRDLATVGVGGSEVRIRISNLMGNEPLDIGAATVAEDLSGASVVPGTVQKMTFGGASTTAIPVGQVAYSDPVTMEVSPLETLAISVFVSDSDQITVHPCCTTPDVSFANKNGAGDATAALTGASYNYASPWPRLVDAVDVLSPSADPASPPSSSAFLEAMDKDPNGSIVVVGDSITDGFNATMRWTDVLQKRVDMLPASEQRAIINEGITANTLTDTARNYSKVGGGPAGLDRLAMDALDQSGVSAVVIFLGTNDLYFGADASQVIAGLQQAANEIHQAGKEAIVVTLTPRMAGKEPWSAQEQSYLEQINQWILTSGVFDSVIDFASVISDMYNGQCTPTSIFPPYDSGDHLHPDNAGQVAMGDAVTGAEIGLPSLPRIPLLTKAVPTKGCQGVTGIPNLNTGTSPPKVNGSKTSQP